jgi:hypothetical protein
MASRKKSVAKSKPVKTAQKTGGGKAASAKAGRAKTGTSKTVTAKAGSAKARTAKVQAPKAGAANTGAAKKTATAKSPAKAKVVIAETANRRRFQRRETHINARLDYNDRRIDGMVTNLSLQGCLFTPRVPVPVGTRVKLHLHGEANAVAATVKAVTSQGVHCLLHAGGATLSRLSADLDDLALLMLDAGRPHEVPVKAVASRRRTA